MAEKDRKRIVEIHTCLITTFQPTSEDKHGGT